MLNKKDKRNIILIIIALIAVIGGFILIRGCNRNEVEEKNPDHQEIPIVEPDDKEVVEKEEPTQGSSNQYYVSNQTPSTEEKEEEDIYPEVELDAIYYEAEFKEEFSLPEIPEFDKNGNPIQVIGITYKFRELDSSEYITVMEFSTKRLGDYMITYRVENEKHYVSEITIYVTVKDTVAPQIIGQIEILVPNTEQKVEMLDLNEEKTEDSDVEREYQFIEILSGSIVNQSVHFTFSDNDEVVYAEYYNENEDISIAGDMDEDEATRYIVPIDSMTDFILNKDMEEGEYHIRVYDRSWNCYEFVVILDVTAPQVEDITYQPISKETGDFVQVTITFNEEIELDEKLAEDGWKFVENNQTITKLYEASEGIIEDIITITDSAGNTHFGPVKIQYEVQKNEEIDEPDGDELDQTDKVKNPDEKDEETEGSNKGESDEKSNEEKQTIEIKDCASSNDDENQKSEKITHSENSDESGTIPTAVEDYQFPIADTDGNEIAMIEFSISSLDTIN